MTKGGPMQVSQIRAARWAITGGLAAFLAIAAAGFPSQAHAFVCNGQFDLLQKGYCSTTTTQGCGTSFDAACPAGETCKTFNFFDPGDPEKDGGDQLRISLAVGTSTITGPTGAPDNMTVHKIRFDLDCVQNSGGNGTNTLCMDQGDVVEYMGDATISTDCPGVTWTSSQPLGGMGANEVVFTPSAAIVIPQSCAPSQQSPPPACGGCKLEFGLRVVHQEPAGSDATPQIVEEAAGYIQGQGDAVCNEGLTGSLQSGSTQTANMPICPSCTIDQCNLGCDEQVTGMCQAQTASTPCADTDGNACTTAGCELSEIPGVTPSQASIGVCVQTHLFASNSTPCADTDGNACTTAGCDGAGTCDQNHSVQVCTTDQCNTGCDTTTGQCTAQQASTPRAETDGNSRPAPAVRRHGPEHVHDATRRSSDLEHRGVRADAPVCVEQHAVRGHGRQRVHDGGLRRGRDVRPEPQRAGVYDGSVQQGVRHDHGAVHGAAGEHAVRGHGREHVHDGRLRAEHGGGGGVRADAPVCVEHDRKSRRLHSRH